MTTRIVSWLLFAISCVTPIAADAAFNCVAPGDWGCGSFEIVSTRSLDAFHCRSISFQGGDQLLEVNVNRGKENRTFQHLVIEPSHLDLYHGDEGLFMMGFGIMSVVIKTLRSAYPSGSDAVPAGISEVTTKMTDLNGNVRVLTITTDRINRHQIKYFLKASDESTITGLWDSERPAPLPDSYDVRDWRHKAPGTLKTLQDVRSLNPEKTRPMK